MPHVPPPALVIFDIDGTLTRTVGVDDDAFVRAVRDALRLATAPFSTDWADYPHATDEGLAAEICRRALSRDIAPDEIARTKARFFEILEDSARRDPHRFQPVPGAAEALRLAQLTKRETRGEGGWRVALATGAWRESATLKLRMAGLMPIVQDLGLPLACAGDLGGPCDEEGHTGGLFSRESIVLRALARAAERYADPAPPTWRRIVLVGDGLWDLRTARNLDKPFIGVAAEDTDSHRLRREGASHVLPHLHPSVLLDALETAQTPHPPAPTTNSVP